MPLENMFLNAVNMKVGIIQICSVLDYRINIEKIRNFLKIARDLNVKAVFLPECFYSMSDGTKSTPYLVENGNEHFQNIQALAKDFNLYILAGSAATLENGLIINRNYNFDPDGNDIGCYDKIHLFSCDIKNSDSKNSQKIINESDIYTPGKLSKIIKVNDIKIGLSICFDIRYPSMYRDYVLKGAQICTISAAFTVPTGKAHWHILNRARAIENQCFVIAPAQWGKNNDLIETFGHSLIIDPWGEILLDAKNGEKFITADLDTDMIREVRKKVKVF